MLKSNPFSDRFFEASERFSRFCFGVDPSAQLLHDWGLPDSVQGLEAFCNICLDAAVGRVGIVKPQVAFFERFGYLGLKCLTEFIAALRANGILVIADAKRGDIGTSVSAYGDAWLGAGTPFNVDAITTHAYLGLDALAPLFERAHSTDTAVFVVVKSSNPEGAALQGALDEGQPVALRLAQQIGELNSRIGLSGGVGPIGAVVGATLGTEGYATVAAMPNALFLVPGVGAQGATVAQSNDVFREANGRAVLSASRSILGLGPDVAALAAGLDAIRDEVAENTIMA